MTVIGSLLSLLGQNK